MKKRTSQTGTNYFKKRFAFTYDRYVRQMIHHYDEMQEAIFDPLVLDTNKEIMAADLGLGTGNLTGKILKWFSRSRVTGIEISEDMIRVSKRKLCAYNGRFGVINGNFFEIDFPKEHYDLVVSCMSLHHISDPTGKRKFYKKVYDSLKRGGWFSFSDPVLHEQDHLTKYYSEKLHAYVRKNYRYAEYLLKHERDEDFPEKVSNHLLWLKQAGFKKPHLVWQKWNYAVIAAEK